jgi:hypothetical protein
MLTLAAQFGLGDHPTHANLLAPLLVIAVSACGGGLLLAVLQYLVPRIRRSLHSRRVRSRRIHAAANAELRARALMDELCPYGWRAQIILFGSTDELPPGTPNPEQVRVALDWAGLSHDDFRPPVVRRVWAETVHEALEAMVADRMTDETLQQIEERALSDGAEWPDR